MHNLRNNLQFRSYAFIRSAIAGWLACVAITVSIATPADSPPKPSPAPAGQSPPIPAAKKPVEVRSAGEKASPSKQETPGKLRTEAAPKPAHDPRETCPEDRDEKLQKFQERWKKQRPESWKMTPEEWQAKRDEIQERLEVKLADLRKKQAGGTLSTNDQRRLKQMEVLLKRFKSYAATNAPGRGPTEPCQ